MYYESIIDTADKSYYTDRLEEITGKPRNHWTNLSLIRLHDILKRELDRGKGVVSNDNRSLL